MFDDLTPTDTSYRDSLSPPSSDVAIYKEVEMSGMEYPFLDGINRWQVSSPEGMQFSAPPQSPGAMQHSMAANSNWENFLQWDALQHHDSSTSPSLGSAQARFAQSEAQRQSLYSRRAGLGNVQPSLEISENMATSGPLLSSGIPFTFGQAPGMTPAFDFTTPGSMVSPMEHNGMHSYGMRHSQSDSKSPVGSAHGSAASPFTMPGPSLSSARPGPPPSNGSIRQSPDSSHGKRGISDSPMSSPEPSERPAGLKKRKSDDADDSRRGSKGQPIKKTAHNMIEKRYRTNLNDKIAALRDSVPSLRVMSRPGGGDEEDDDPEDLEGLTPAHKLNKATVLSKATEYIRHLEKRNKKLQDENTALLSRMESYQKMSMAPFSFVGAVSSPDVVTRYEDPFSHSPPGSSTSQAPPQGMIRVPDDIQALRQAGLHGSHYVTSNAGYAGYPAPVGRPHQQGPPMVNGRGGGYMNKLMVGSLAGLMLFEGFLEPEQSGDEPEGRGLFALPISLIEDVAGYLFPRKLLLGASPQEAMSLLKFLLIIGAFISLLMPMLDFKPRPKKKSPHVQLTSAPSLASPVEVRRKAWLTAIQTVWVPQHQFILEAAALVLKTLKLSTRRLIGWQGYAFLWNVTKEQEDARIKAWDIALDAQLTGGDAEISMSRLLLTLLASGTLPDSPVRLMLKALHIRVLLWEVAKAGYGTWYMFDELSMKMARIYWNQARIEHKLVANRSMQRDGQDASQPMPTHLVALLDMECDEVLVKPIVQRAYNLAWNRPTAEHTQVDEGTDSVVEDFAISSPLDALAAWLSSLVINNVLKVSLVMNESNQKAVMSDLDMAISIAPPTSAIQIRALATKAVLSKNDRLQLIEAAYKALPCPSRRDSSNLTLPLSPQPLLIIDRSSISADVPVALVFAKCLALVENQHPEITQSPVLRAQAQQKAVNTLLSYWPTEKNFTLLSFVAAYKVLDHFVHDAVLQRKTRPTLERMANCMRVWIGKEGRQNGVSAIDGRIRTKVVERCIGASKLLTGIAVREGEIEEESDAGYGSEEEEERKC